MDVVWTMLENASADVKDMLSTLSSGLREVGEQDFVLF